MASRVKFIPRKVATPKELKERWERKKNQIETLSSNIGRLRRHISEDLKSDEEKTFLTALAIAIIDKTGERVGNEESADNGNFGVTGLRKKHININGNTVTLTYRGKSGVLHNTSFDSSVLAKSLKKAIKNSGGIRVFQTSDGFRIKNDGVNRYLETYDISAKDIRGYRSNDWIIKGLSKQDIPKTEGERKKIFLSVLKKVAEKIGHGKSTLRNHYMIPEIETSYVNDGKIIDISDKEKYEKGGKMKVVSDGRKGGLLYGPTDKDGGKGIKAEVAGGKKVILGGGEVVINEQAVKENCEELNRINTSAGGRAIPCNVEGNTSRRMTFGGLVGSKNPPKEGLFIDNSNRQRFHIDDNSAIIDYKLIIDKSQESFLQNEKIERKCEDILKKWDGYKYYPDISKIRVIFDPHYLDSSALFGYDRKKDIIIINSKKIYHERNTKTIETKNTRGNKRNDDELSGWLRQSIGGRFFHELQHTIQYREKIEISPSNPIWLMSELKKKYRQEGLSDAEFEKWVEKKEGKHYAVIRYNFYKEIPSEKEALEVQNRFMGKMEDGGKIKPTHTLQEFDELIEQLEVEAKNAIDNNERKKLEKLNKLIGDVIDQRNSIYFNNGGKIKESITKKQIQDVISGKSKVSNGEAIHAASSYIRETKRTISKPRESKQYKDEEEKLLIDYINKNSLWIPIDGITQKYVNEGSEQRVYFEPSGDVIKLNSGLFYNSWEDYLNSLLIHNYFFPDTAYSLLGFAKEEGELYAVVRQIAIDTSEKNRFE